METIQMPAKFYSCYQHLYVSVYGIQRILNIFPSFNIIQFP